jgi:2-iminobutanoate/2-iminopropanoate deaminase
MPRQAIHTDAAPTSPYYSQGVRAGGQVFVSGMVGLDPATGQLAGPLIAEQTRQALTNCITVLEAGGATIDDVAEVGVLLADPADFAGFNDEWARWFPQNPPARYVAKLGVELAGVLVSIRMTAFVAEPDARSTGSD